MEKLIITVACDSRTSYPINHYCPPQEDIDGVAQQYLDGIKAGAAIAHIHGIRTLEETMQADGKPGVAHESGGLEATQRSDPVAEADPVMQFGVASARHRGEGQAHGAPPGHDGGRVQRPRRIFQSRSAIPAQAHDGDPSGRGIARLCQGRRRAQSEARSRMLPHRRVLESRIRPQARLSEGQGLHHAVPRLARRHLDAADREGADLHGRSPAEKLHLERQRDESRRSNGICCRSRCRSAATSASATRTIHISRRENWRRTTRCWSSAW